VSDERVFYAALERELGLLLRRGASLNREVAAEVHPGLDAASYSTLARIAATAPARASELSEYFGIDKGAVSRQIRELERLGLVERAADPRRCASAGGAAHRRRFGPVASGAECPASAIPRLGPHVVA
jgi:hypothetical protein